MFLKMSGEKRLLNSVKLLPLSIKSINPLHRYSHIPESYACILKIFVIIVDPAMNFLISFEICSTSKLSR